MDDKTWIIPDTIYGSCVIPKLHNAGIPYSNMYPTPETMDDNVSTITLIFIFILEITVLKASVSIYLIIFDLFSLIVFINPETLKLFIIFFKTPTIAPNVFVNNISPKSPAPPFCVGFVFAKISFIIDSFNSLPYIICSVMLMI